MPLDPLASHAGWRARLSLDFERRGPRTVLARREHDGPLVVQKALHPEGEAVCHAIVVHPPSGLVGGDDLRLQALAGPGAHALLTTPGAGKWYRSNGRVASQHLHFDVADGACLEWLPQETIVYDSARARITWSAALARDATLLAWDLYCLGRTGSGEGFGRVECAIESTVHREGRLAWFERGRVAPGSPVAASAAGLASQPVFGTFVAAAPAIEDEWVAAAREAQPASGVAGVTRLPGVLLARWRGADSEDGRRYFIDLWKRLRPRVARLEAVEPRIWST